MMRVEKLATTLRAHFGMLVAAAALVGACSATEVPPSGGEGGVETRTGAGGEGGTTGDRAGGAGGVVSVAAGAGSGDAGAGGAMACADVECEGLEEEACKALAVDCESLVPACQGLERSWPGCMPRYGHPWPQDIEEEPVMYAGCASSCCGGECEVSTDAEAAAESPSGQCWTLSSPPVPDGWVLLSDVDTCDSLQL